MLTLKKHSNAELFLSHSKYQMKSTDIILLVFPQGHRLSHAKLLILELFENSYCCNHRKCMENRLLNMLYVLVQLLRDYRDTCALIGRGLHLVMLLSLSKRLLHVVRRAEFQNGCLVFCQCF